MGAPFANSLRLAKGNNPANVHRQLVQSLPLDDADIECLIEGLRLVTPCTQRIDRLIDLLADPRRWSAGYGSTWVNIIPASHGE